MKKTAYCIKHGKVTIPHPCGLEVTSGGHNPNAPCPITEAERELVEAALWWDDDDDYDRNLQRIQQACNKVRTERAQKGGEGR